MIATDWILVFTLRKEANDLMDRLSDVDYEANKKNPIVAPNFNIQMENTRFSKGKGTKNTSGYVSFHFSAGDIPESRTLP